MSDIVRRILPETAGIQGLQPVFTAFQQAVTHEEEAYKYHGLYETDEMKTLDNSRKEITADIFGIVKLKLKSRDVDERAAAEMINKEIVRTYRDYYRFGYETRSAYISNIIQALQAQKHQAAVAKLSLTGQINELIGANYLFHEAFDAKTDEERRIKELGSASSIRPQTNAALKDFIDYITASYRVLGNTPADATTRTKLEQIAFIFNGLVDQAKKSDAHRRGHKNNDESSETDSNEHRRRNESSETNSNGDDRKDESSGTNSNERNRMDESSGTD
jgi:paraquat-inducible protein B